VYRPTSSNYSKRYLDRDERYEIARLHDGGLSVRAIARQLGRQPSTVSRELRRNRDSRTGRYQPERADRLAWERQQRPKPSKIAGCSALRVVVQGMLNKRYSPEQIAGRLRLLHPQDKAMQISHETIYQSIYVYPRGELRRELKANLRSGRAVRRARGQRTTRGQIDGLVSIHDRPEEVDGRLIPGHHEGDLVMGSTASNSAVGTIVERTTGYLTLLHLPDGYGTAQVTDAIVERMSELPNWFTKTLTWDRGRELTRHRDVTARTGMDVYFADPYSPHQRGSNENTNGLLREYLPKGTDLSVHDRSALLAIEHELNDRPRKRLGFYTPREAYAALLEQHPAGVATTP
jgi:IS30 family transposase